jgi:hypothetical protein
VSGRLNKNVHFAKAKGNRTNIVHAMNRNRITNATKITVASARRREEIRFGNGFLTLVCGDALNVGVCNNETNSNGRDTEIRKINFYETAIPLPDNA